jgi:hypothetical protein
MAKVCVLWVESTSTTATSRVRVSAVMELLEIDPKTLLVVLAAGDVPFST